MMEREFSKARRGDFGIIGDPVAHSLSPAMQNAALRVWKPQGPTYHAFHVPPADLPAAIQWTKAIGLRGLNVTVPHKVSVLKQLDAVDSSAQRLGAVNTVVMTDRGLVGHNTDGAGFRRALVEDLGFDPAGKTALVLGAGGTGVVIVHELLDLGAHKIAWWNRTPERIKKSAVNLGVDVCSATEACARATTVDLLVNATTVGLQEADGLPLPGLQIRAGANVMDVIYHRDTAFLQEARARGARAIGGLPMLLYQGAEAFALWTGASAPLDVMRKAVQNALGRQKKEV